MTVLFRSVILALPALCVLGCHGARPAHLGTHDGRFTPCPASPNCVSSQAPDAEHRIAALPFTGPSEDAILRLKDLVGSFPRTAIITAKGSYLHVEFTSALFRFVDDVEFLADDAAKVIHVRSASRFGYSDLGANRRRIELIRKRWQAALPSP